jgi:alkylation response protein AidB-like acyl-CoA dehydrogenase
MTQTNTLINPAIGQSSTVSHSPIPFEIVPAPSESIAREVLALQEKLAVIAPERDRNGGVPREEAELIRKSSLFTLAVPKEYGGLGGSISTVLWVVRKIAAIDGGLGRLFGYHLIFSSWIGLLGNEEQRTRYFQKIVQEGAWVGNASTEGGKSVFDLETRLVPEGDHFRLTGKKLFSTGAIVSDLLFTIAVPDDLPSAQDGWIWILVPSDREGVSIQEDWDPIGQKAAYSGRTELNQVKVSAEETLGRTEARTQTPLNSALILQFQIQQANTLLGIGQGALQAARDYTRTQTRSWSQSVTEAATSDPYILERYGEFFSELAAAETLVDRAGKLVEEAIDKGQHLTWEERGRASVAVLAAKATAGRAALHVSQGIFEVTGARSAANRSLGLDRYWRNARTESVHSPLVYHLSNVGNYALNGTLPAPGFYS